mgnify:CR=1 FL=1
MTDEVFSDNLDEAPEADLEAAAAVEALPAEGESVQETADETVEAEPTAEVVSDESEEGKEDDEQDAGAKAVEDFSNSLRTLEGKWYVLHTYSGYENKVASSIEKAVENRKLHDLIPAVNIPTETVTEVKDGKSREVERKLFPGYVLVKMVMTDETWYLVRNTRGCTGFVGQDKSGGSKPIPLTEDEIAAMGVEKREIEVNYAVGDSVRVIDGPLAGFIGVVSALEPDKNRVNVTVSMFGRETPVELELDQVETLEE